jgi:hypothetical protein
VRLDPFPFTGERRLPIRFEQRAEPFHERKRIVVRHC